MVATPPLWLTRLLEKQEQAQAATRLQAQMRGKNTRKSMVSAPAPVRGPGTQPTWEQQNASSAQDESALLASLGLGSEEELSAEWAAAEAEAIAVLHKYVVAVCCCTSLALTYCALRPCCCILTMSEPNRLCLLLTA